jgi:hypothetical protein
MHRRGDTEQKLESPLGRFVLQRHLRTEFYDAGLEYGSLVRHYYRSIGVRLEINEGHPSTGAGVSAATTKWLAKEVERIEEPLKKFNHAGFDGMRKLCVFETDVSPGTEWSTGKVLYRLALMLRKLGRRRGSEIVAVRDFEAVAAE